MPFGMEGAAVVQCNQGSTLRRRSRVVITCNPTFVPTGPPNSRKVATFLSIMVVDSHGVFRIWADTTLTRYRLAANIFFPGICHNANTSIITPPCPKRDFAF